MKGIKKLLIIFILVAIVIVFILYLLGKDNNPEEYYYGSDIPQDVLEIDEALKEEEGVTSYYLVDSLIERFLSFINTENEEAIIAVLDNEKTEIDYNNIKISNTKFYTQKVLCTRNLENAYYYTYGLVEVNNTLDIYCFMLKLDYTNNTFKIAPIKRETYENVENNNYDKLTGDIISKNNYNTFTIENVSMEERCRVYLDDFLVKARYSLQLAYNLLEEEYKEQHFKSLEDFNSYINNNLNELSNMEITNVGYIFSDSGMEYSVETDIGRTIIIKEKKLLHYSILLDDYSVLSKEELDFYNGLEDDTKITYNLNKLISMLNNKDYIGIYNYLDNDFKSLYFTTQNSFEEYIEKKFFNTNFLTNTDITKEDGIYRCYCIIAEDTSLSAEMSEVVFYMVLKDNSFVFSIDMQ